MEPYETPTLELILFESTDVITESGIQTPPGP